jgi:hypothetical protein
MTVNYTQEDLELIYGKLNELPSTQELSLESDPGLLYPTTSMHSADARGDCIFTGFEGQPVSVKPKDYGKAVAIHCGPDPDPSYTANTAFLLSGSNATNLAN